MLEWEEIKEVLHSYYQNLYQTSSPSTDQIDKCLNHVNQCLTPAINEQLLEQFGLEEVFDALMQMAPIKSLGSYGFSACFFQSYWFVVGTDVCNEVLQFLNGRIFDKDMNFTNLVLIPKVKNPVNAKHFRPLSLCNVIYKIASKFLANRLKRVLLDIISKFQSAFLPGKLITDNLIITFEALHTMTTRQGGKRGSMDVKLDMAKTYDQVEWGFLEAIMRKMRFN